MSLFHQLVLLCSGLCVWPGAFQCPFLSTWHVINHFGGGLLLESQCIVNTLCYTRAEKHKHLNQCVVTWTRFVGECSCKEKGRASSC